jgi:hypothetical protein
MQNANSFSDLHSATCIAADLSRWLGDNLANDRIFGPLSPPDTTEGG